MQTKEYASPNAKHAPTSEVIARLFARAQERGYTTIYHVYRYRAEKRLDRDRLPDAVLHAKTLKKAVKKLFLIAGLDESEIELHELHAFNAGNISELCDRLQSLTGDVYRVCPYEMPQGL